MIAEYHALTKNSHFLHKIERTITAIVCRIEDYRFEMLEEGFRFQTYVDTVSTNVTIRRENISHINGPFSTSSINTTTPERQRIWATMVSATMTYREKEKLAKSSKGAKNRSRYTRERDES